MTSSDAKVVIWAEEFYELLESESELTPYGERVFVGKTTDIFKRLDCTIGNYTPIMRVLTGSGAVAVRQRGNRSQPSVIELMGAENISSDPLTRARESDKLRLDEIERRVAVLEKWRETTGGINLGETLRDFEVRLSKAQTGAFPQTKEKEK